MKALKVEAPLRITLIYITVASVWIVGSDQLIAILDPGATWLSSLKGLIFVAVTGIMLYAMIRADYEAQERAGKKIREQAHLLEQTSDAIISTDMDFNVKTFNPAAERIYGWQAEEILGKPLNSLFQSQYADTTREEVLRSFAEVGTWNGEVSQMRKDGRRIYIQSAVSYVTSPEGERVGAITVNRDITERKALEEDLLLTQFSVDHASVGIIRTDFNAQILSANEHICQMLGYTASELLGMHVYDIDPGFPLDKWKRHRSGLRQSGSDTFETRHRRKDGTLIPVEITTTLVKFHGEEFSVSFLRDISERKQAEEAIRSLAKFPEENPSPIIRVSEDGAIQFVNKAGQDALVEWQMKPGQRAPEALQEVVSAALAADQPFEREVVYQERTYSFYVAPIHEGGYANLYGRDITQRKLAEQKLRESQEKFSTAFHSSPVAMVIATEDGVYVEVNQAFSELTGYPYEDLLGRTSLEMQLISPLESEKIIQAAAESGSGSVRNFERAIRSRDGEMHSGLLSLEKIMLEGVPHRLATIQDITERKRAEETVRQSREMLDLFVEGAPVALAMFDRDMCYMAVSRRWITDYHLDPESVIGRSHYEVFPEISEEWRAFHRQGMAGETIAAEEDPFERADGTVQWLHWVIKPWYARAGEVGGIIILTEDISERKNAEQALRESEERFRTMVDVSPIAKFVDRQGRIDYANPAFMRLVGASRPEQVLGKSPFEFFLPERHAAIEERVRTVLEQHAVYSQVDDTLVSCEGSQLNVEVTALRFVDLKGEAIQVMLNDVTERRRAENRIKKLNRIYLVLSSINETIVRIREPQALFDLACEIAVEKGGFKLAWVGMLDPGSETLRVAAQSGATTELVEAMLNVAPSRMDNIDSLIAILRMGKPLIFNDVQNDPRLEPIRKRSVAMAVRSQAAFPLRIGGEVRGMFGLYSGEANFFDEEEVRLLNELVTDICFALDVAALESRRREAEDQVRESRARLQSTLDNMLEGCQIINFDWRYEYLNDAAVRYSHRERLEMLGHSLMDVYPGIEESDLFDTLERCMSSRLSEQITCEFFYPDGSSQWFDMSIQPVPEGIFILSADITDRKLAEEALQQLNSELEERVMERTAQLNHVKERVEAIINNSPDAILLINPSGSIDVGNPAFSAWFGYDRDTMRGEPLSALAAPESAGTVNEALTAVSREMKTQRAEIAALRKDGSSFELMMALAPVEQTGELLGVVCSMQDISKHKEVERLKDAFVSNVSHELRTPITSMRLNHKLIRMNPERESVYLERLEREASRLNDLIEDLLRLSRLDAGRTELVLAPVDLNEMIDEHVGDRTPIAESRSLRLSAAKKKDLLPVMADRGLLGQALSVLLTNAINYTPEGGAIVVRTARRRKGGQTWVGFEVSDNGPGIPEEEIPHLLERFYRGKTGRNSGSAGTGLGLAIAHEIVSRHHGRIEIANNKDQGATFSVWMKAIEE